jgi:hypothetical protein
LKLKYNTISKYESLFPACTKYICSTGLVSVTNTLFYTGYLKGRGQEEAICMCSIRARSMPDYSRVDVGLAVFEDRQGLSELGVTWTFTLSS